MLGMLNGEVGSFASFPNGGAGSIGNLPNGGVGSLASLLKGGVGSLLNAENGGVGSLATLDRAGNGGVGSFVAAGGWNRGVEVGRGLSGVDWAKLELADWLKILVRFAAGLGRIVVVGCMDCLGGSGTVPVLLPVRKLMINLLI